jgi:hypothetical protein
MSIEPGATNDLGMNLPAAPGGFVNPLADGYVDQTGHLRALRTTEQLAGDRADWVRGFDQAAQTALYSRDGTADRYTTEARAEHIARFDAAARQDNLNPVEPISPDLQRHADLHLMPLNPKAADYQPQLGDHAQHAGEFTALAAEIGFMPGIGNAFLERLVVVSEQKKGMTPEAVEYWGQRKRDELLGRVGSEQALTEQMAKAKAELTRITGVGKNLAGAIASDAVLNDWYLHSILLNHSRARESFEATRPDKRR